MIEEKTLHESADALERATMDRHRAYRSLIEELDAVDWYTQRIDATNDKDLEKILTHNRDEEKEHAAMLIEWLRRRDPALDARLRAYLFTEAPIEAIGAIQQGDPPAGSQLNIGSLRASGRGA